MRSAKIWGSVTLAQTHMEDFHCYSKDIMPETHGITSWSRWLNRFCNFPAGETRRNRCISARSRLAAQLRGIRSLKVSCEYTTTTPATYSSFPHAINPSYPQRRQTATAACPATARALMMAQELCWRFLLQIRRNGNLDPSLPSFIRCSSYYLPIPGRHFGHILMRNSVQGPQAPFLTRNCLAFQAVFPQHICRFGHCISGRGTQIPSNIITESRE